MSVVIHEVSHGYAAYLMGDPTAKNAGRLTLSPLAHLDFMGSLVVPLLAYFSAGFMFGWAKPVPYNPYNLKKKKVSVQPAVRSNRSSYWSLPMAPSPRKKEYHYYSSDPAPPPEPVTYILPYEPKSREPVYKFTGKFPKIDEAIAAAKKYRDEQ